MKGLSELIVFLGMVLLPVAHAAEKGDQNFSTQAAIANLAEIELANLAREKATQPQVQQYAEHLIQDHQQASEKLKSLATQKGITLPTEVDAKHKREKERLAKMNGADFDRAYVDAMVKDHKEVLKKFEKEGKQGKDPELKAFAAEIVPKLQEHLKEAQQLQNSIKSAKKSS